jgi:hypothetical protein
MNEKQRQYQETKGNHCDGGDDDPGGLSDQAHAAVSQVAAVDAMIDNILSSATTGNYLESIRQRGGQ